MKCKFLWCLGLSLVSLPAAAQPRLAQLSGPFHEVVQDEVSVSGSVVVGAIRASSLGGMAVLQGLLVSSHETSLCLTMQSRDGIYFAQNTFSVPASLPSAASLDVLLPYDATAHSQLLRRLGPSELSVRVGAGDCHQVSEVLLVPSSATGVAAGDVILQVNAMGASDVIVESASGADVVCDAITEGRQTIYDHLCRIPEAWLVHPTTTLTLVRERYGRELPKVAVELGIGAAR